MKKNFFNYLLIFLARKTLPLRTVLKVNGQGLEFIKDFMKKTNKPQGCNGCEDEVILFFSDAFLAMDKVVLEDKQKFNISI
ncbi:hypothetical protein N9J26_00095 [bacterium]|nr:hypothetical protein [bacterium]